MVVPFVYIRVLQFTMIRLAIRRCWQQRGVRWSLTTKTVFDPYLVLSRDLFQGSPQLNSPNGTPTPFCEGHDKFENSALGDDVLQDSVLLRLYLTSELIRRISQTSNMADIQEKVLPVQTFLGDQFSLLDEEKLAVLYGMTNIHLHLETYATNQKSDFHSRSLGYSTRRLRVCGKQLFHSCWLQNTTFDNERYLSMLQQDIMLDVRQFEASRSLIVEFMKRQTIHQNLQPYRGAMKQGPITDYNEYLNAKEDIQELTAVGAFYTMIGICWIKFGREHTVNELITKKIINGSNGLIGLITQHRASRR